jgi:ubiquinone/menaquinone biosynthesis C-methylase UbiE
MTSQPSGQPGGLYGCGSIRDADGAPLRPGGLVLTERLLDFAGFRAGDKVADIGCGLGASAGLMKRRGIDAIGVDRLFLAADRASQFVVADGARLPFASGSLDGILSECSLSAISDPQAALAEWFRVLKRGGRLALSDVYARAATRSHGGGPKTQAALLHGIVATGFRIQGFEDHSSVLGPWVAQFIFKYGSLDALWGGACGLDARAVRKAEPGYCLAVASKPGKP